jgi:hypothetical protein
MYYCYYYNGFTALCWAFDAFSICLSYKQPVGILGRGISRRPLRTHRTTKTQMKAHKTDVHGLRGIRTYDPIVRVSEDGSCLRKRDHCDRSSMYYYFLMTTWQLFAII